MDKKEFYLTEQGYENLKQELEHLKFNKRPEVIESLKEARALGDLSENAEYDAARTEQGIIEGRIIELEHILEEAIVVKEVSKDKVGIGTNVKLQYIEDGDTETYLIVGNKESDPFNNKISNESPIAQAIVGLSVGEVATVDSQNGIYSVKIMEIF